MHSASALLDALKFRYATKAFDPNRVIPEETLAALEQSLVLTPSSFGLQPWKFIIIRDAAVREKLLGHSWNQRQVVDASHLVVFTRRTGFGLEEINRFAQSIAETRGVSLESVEGYRSLMAGFVANHKDVDRWTANQVYIASGQFNLACALLGVDACPMEGINPSAYDDILGLKEQNLATVLVCPIGYRSAEDKYAGQAKVRHPAAHVIERR